MAKIFKTDEANVKLADLIFENTGLAQVGIRLKVMSLTKANTIAKVSKASATTEFLTKEQDTIHMFLYEEAFDRLSDEYKNMILEGALSNVSYDSEKDKINVDSSQYGELLRMRSKYGDKYINLIETAKIVMEEIEEEEKEHKLAEKESKRKNKNA